MNSKMPDALSQKNQNQNQKKKRGVSGILCRFQRTNPLNGASRLQATGRLPLAMKSPANTISKHLGKSTKQRRCLCRLEVVLFNRKDREFAPSKGKISAGNTGRRQVTLNTAQRRSDGESKESIVSSKCERLAGSCSLFTRVF